MSTTAVTPATSAAATEEQLSEFLPTDEKYRLTGEMPAETHDDSASSTKDQPGAEGDDKTPGAGAAESAAASAAASTQDRKPGRTPADSESRWQKLSRENRELREQLAREQGREEGRSEQRDQRQASQPGTEQKPQPPAEPKIDDVDPVTKKPKFATYDEYLAAVRKYDRDMLREDLKKEMMESFAKGDKDRAAAAAEQVIEQTVNQRVEAVRKAHPDYDEAVKSVMQIKDEHGQDALFYTKGSPIDGFFLDSDIGHEVMYHVLKNFDQHKHIFARDRNGKYLMNPIRQVRELAKIENSLSSGSSQRSNASAGASEPGANGRPAKAVSQASRPPNQTAGNGAVQKDAVEQAVEDGDQETYMREQNAKALARLSKGK